MLFRVVDGLLRLKSLSQVCWSERDRNTRLGFQRSTFRRSLSFCGLLAPGPQFSSLQPAGLGHLESVFQGGGLVVLRCAATTPSSHIRILYSKAVTCQWAQVQSYQGLLWHLVPSQVHAICAVLALQPKFHNGTIV